MPATPRALPAAVLPVLLLGVVAAASSAVLVRGAQAPELSPLQIAFWRMVITTALLALPAATVWRRQLLSVSAGDRRVALLAGGFLALHFATWISSLAYTSVAASTALVTTQPIFVAVGAWWLLGERVTARGWAGTMLALLGTVLLAVADARAGPSEAFRAPLLGDALALLGAIFAAAYMLCGRRLRAHLELGPYIAMVYPASALFLALFCLALIGAGSLAPAAVPAASWPWLFGLAVLPQLVGHSSFNWALRFLPAHTVCVAILGEPVGATVLAFLLFSEVPGIGTLVGAGLALLGVALAVWPSAAGRT